MKTTEQQTRICPRCGKPYTGYPAVSRVDDWTPICPDCYPGSIVIRVKFFKPSENKIIMAV